MGKGPTDGNPFNVCVFRRYKDEWSRQQSPSMVDVGSAMDNAIPGKQGRFGVLVCLFADAPCLECGDEGEQGHGEAKGE